MYDIKGYGAMIEDSVRNDAYREALRRHVRPGSVVLDIGTGTGIFALMACQLGAGRVYALEPSNYLQMAVEIARENQLEDRIVFLQEESSEVTLPQRADVVVSDLRGVVPLFTHHIRAIADARKRLLAPSGTLIPSRDRVWAAIVRAPETYASLCDPWDSRPYGFHMRSPLKLIVNRMHRAELEGSQLAVEPALWAELDYATIEERDFSGRLEWVVEAAGDVHGLALWFDSDLTEGVSLSSAPTEPGLIYGQAFLPWERPVSLAPGDEVEIQLDARLVGRDYHWIWRSTVRSGSEVKARFRQSTFFGIPLSTQDLARSSSRHVPTLNEKGELALVALGWMKGSDDLETVARRVAEQFPDQFADWQMAFREIAVLARSYAR